MTPSTVARVSIVARDLTVTPPSQSLLKPGAVKKLPAIDVDLDTAADESRDPPTDEALVDATPAVKSRDARGVGLAVTSCEPSIDKRGERLVKLVITFSVAQDKKFDGGSLSTGEPSAAGGSLPRTNRHLNVSRKRRDIVQ